MTEQENSRKNLLNLLNPQEKNNPQETRMA